MLWSVQASAEPAKDPGLEEAKKTFERKMRQIDEEAEKSREKATKQLREEFEDVIHRKVRNGDQASATFFKNEETRLLGENGDQGRQAFQKMRKRMPLMHVGLVVKDKTVEWRREYDKNVPGLIEGRPTTELFLFSPSPSSSTWGIPPNAKTFEVYADNLFPGGVPGNANCIMEILIDGKLVAKTDVIGPASPVEKLVVDIPRNAQQLTLKTNPHQGGIDYDWCAWVEPAFYDRK
jgi:hypothetical protein